MRSLGFLTDWRRDEAAVRAAWILLAIALAIMIAKAVWAVRRLGH